MIDKQELHKIFSEMRKGNNSQFEILYKNYNQLVYKIAFSILKNKENSEDVIQTVFAKICNLKKEQLPSSKEATWLYAVTKNEALTFLRKEKTNISLEEAYNIDTGKECEELQDIVDTEKYNKIISGLSLKEKEIVSRKIVGELSFKEIARILNEPIGTVQWRYYKALNSLKLLLGNISMFIVTLTLYICSTQYKKSENVEIANETSRNSQTTEKSESKDDYNLINSRAIADYCRSIKHKFNTEELAVLVYRNQNMSIEEKINKYNDLIKNYPDMEVIERINCEHYDSVKTMIKKEIQRLKILNKKIKQNDENCIYTWTEFNKSTQKYECSDDIEHACRTYKEVLKDIQDYIKEYDDTISFRITKKYFDKRKEKIFADFIVENKKVKLVDIVESNKEFLDIDQIFLNIPTPFKKGDILTSNSPIMRSYGDDNDVFVLEYLCTWRKNLSMYLADGNYDSSDMIGYGYFFINDDTTEFVRDHKWNYDSFEYYDGDLTGRNRILKDISSFIKGKIELELFVHAYDVYKNEFKSKMPDFYTDEGLQLAGFSKEDILKYKNIGNWEQEDEEEV